MWDTKLDTSAHKCLLRPEFFIRRVSKIMHRISRNAIEVSITILGVDYDMENDMV